MEEKDKVETTENIPVEAKEGATSASCEASTLCETGTNQSNESKSSSSTSNTETFDSSKSASSYKESCRTGTNVTESKSRNDRLNAETDTTVSGDPEIHEKSVDVIPTSMQASDRESTLGSEKEGESKSNKTGSLKSLGDKPVEIDSSQTKESMLRGKQDFKETVENGSGSSATLDQEKEDNTKDGDEQQENLVINDSCNEKNNDIGDSTNQNSAKELERNDDGFGSKPKKKRKCATRVTDDQNTSPVSEEMSTEDVDAEWSLDEKRRLLDALDNDAGRRHWNAIANKVKTKNVQQVKKITEKLRAEANGLAPVHLVAEKDDPLQAWINVCERLRGGQEDIDAKCIPQVMTIAAVEPTSSNQEDTNGPNYARIYTFLSSILKGQATVGLTPVDARVVLELIQSLEMKLLNANLLAQQDFLRKRYTGITKDLEKEQIILALDELEKEIKKDVDKETSEENGTPSSCASTEMVVDAQNNERSESPITLVSLPSGTIAVADSEEGTISNSDKIKIENAKEAKTPVDIQTYKSSLSNTAAVTDLEQPNISNSNEMRIAEAEKEKTPADVQTDKSSETTEALPSNTAAVADLEQPNISNFNEMTTAEAEKEKTPADILTDKSSETTEALPSNTAAVADLEQPKISNFNEMTMAEAEKEKTAMDIQTRRPKSSETLPPENAMVADLQETSNDKTDTEVTKKIESSWWTLTVVAPGSEHTKVDETNTSNHQPSPSSSKTGETSESSSSITCFHKTVSSGSKRKRFKQITKPHSPESRKNKIIRLKKGLEKPKLSSLNPVCVPVTMLNVKPRENVL